MGYSAGAGRLIVAARTLAVQDTARYTVLPGNATSVRSAPELLGALFAPDEVTWRSSSSPDGSRVAFATTGPIIKVFEVATGIELPLAYAGAFSSGSLN